MPHKTRTLNGKSSMSLCPRNPDIGSIVTRQRFVVLTAVSVEPADKYSRSLDIRGGFVNGMIKPFVQAM
jgi:hypothetical protein